MSARIRILAGITIMTLALALAGCAPAEDAPVVEQPSGPTDADAAAAFEATHPGFSAVEITRESDNTWLVAGPSDVVPEFWIRTWVAPVPDGDVTAMISGTEWSGERALQEVTENAQLMSGDMRQQFMQAVVDYVGIADGEHPGGFVTSVSVVSNVEMSVGFSGDTGDLNFFTFKLDLASGDWVPAP